MNIANDALCDRWLRGFYGTRSFEDYTLLDRAVRTWLNVAYFALKGLKDYGFDEIADAGRETLLSWVRRTPGVIHENYHPQTGDALGVPHFSWSAVFVLKFLLDWEK